MVLFGKHMNGKVKKIFLSADLFAYELEDEEQKPKKQQQPVGSCCSLVIIFAFIGYSIFKVAEFISNPSATSTPQLSEVASNTSIPLPTIAFAAPDYTFADGFKDLVVSGFINSENSVVQRFLIERCSLENLPRSLQNAVVYCPNMNDLTIPGTFENTIISGDSIGISVYPRDCSTFPSSQAFYIGILNPFEIDYTAGDFVDAYIYSLTKTSLAGNIMLRSILPFQIEEYDISPDYLKRWTTRSRTKYSFQPLLTEFEVTGGCNVDNPVLQLRFVVSPTMITTNISYPTILDLFANLGALWTSAFGVLALAFLLYRKLQQSRMKKKKEKKEKKDVELALERPSDESANDKLDQSGTRLKFQNFLNEEQQQTKDQVGDSPDKEHTVDVKMERDHNMDFKTDREQTSDVKNANSSFTNARVFPIGTQS